MASTDIIAIVFEFGVITLLIQVNKRLTDVKAQIDIIKLWLRVREPDKYKDIPFKQWDKF